MGKKSGRWTQGIKLSTVVGLLSAFILLSSAIMGSLVNYLNGRDALAAQTLRLNQYHAGELARIGGTAIRNMQNSLQETADYATDNPAAPEMNRRNLEYFRKSNGFFNSLIVIDEKAILTYNTPDLGLTGQKIDTPQIVKALSLKKPYLSSPYIAPTGRYLVTVSQPLFARDGSYHGILAGSIYLEEENRLGEILGTQSEKEDGSYFYVIDKEGEYVYHPDERKIGELVSDEAIRELYAQGQSGTEQIHAKNDKMYLAGYAFIPQTEWCVVFQTPYANVVDFAKQATFQSSLYMLPAVIVMLLLTLFVSRKLSMPLHTLARYIESLANRRAPDVVPDVEDWNYETKMLKKAILLAEQKSREAENDLLREANHDHLTGLLNRRTLESLTEERIQQEDKFSVVFLDIDHFKSINDTYGHQKGDEVLREMGRILTEQVGGDHSCFRYGGEEFVLLLSDLGEEEALELAEHIRTTVESCPMPVSKRITISLGVAFHKGELTPAKLFRKADFALYQAKETGRNRSVLAV